MPSPGLDGMLARAVGGGWQAWKGASRAPSARARLFSTSPPPSPSPSSGEDGAGRERTSPSLGFIGLGKMGGEMAANLLKRYPLVACDANPSARAALEGRAQGGCRLSFAATPAAVAATPRLAAVFTSLPSVAAVRAVWLGPDGLLSGPTTTPGPILVDLSTSGPALARELAAAAAEARGCPAPATLDAPVSGGVTAARAATLTFLCGGPGGALDSVRPFLGAMGRTIFHVGPQPGAGQAAKLANNLALAVQMAGLCEALALGAASAGVDPARLLAALNASTARCWASSDYPPVPGLTAPSSGAPVPATDGSFKGGFATRLMMKDLDLAAGEAGGARAPLASLPMASAARALYARLAAERGEEVDFSALYAFLYGGRAAERCEK